jgi:Astacin (Peptidase family M12A)
MYFKKTRFHFIYLAIVCGAAYLNAQAPKGNLPYPCALPIEVSERGYGGYVAQQNYWKDQIVPYFFRFDVSAGGRDSFGRAIKTIEANTNICFTPYNGEEKYMKVQPFQGNYSFAQFADQSINLGEYAQSTILHEIGHILGLAHEHQRPDRGNYIAVNMQNVLPGFESQFTIINKHPSAIVTTQYDLSSIMHYPWWAFTKNGSATITDHTFSAIPEYNWVLSPNDTLILNQMYPKKINCLNLDFERPPIAKFDLVEPATQNQMCNYQLISFSSASVGAETTEWIAPGMVPESGKDSIFQAYFTAPGKYSVTLKARNSKGEKEIVKVFEVKACEVPSIINVWPNPAHRQLRFQISELVPIPLEVSLFSMDGKLVFQKSQLMSSFPKNGYELDLPYLPTAQYQLVIDGYGSTLTRNISVAH